MPKKGDAVVVSGLEGGEERPFFVCKTTGYLTKSRVTIPDKLAAKHRDLYPLKGQSFLDWNTMMYYLKMACLKEDVSGEAVSAVRNYVLKLHGMREWDNVPISPVTPEELMRTNPTGGMGPGQYLTTYSPRLTKDSETVEDYLAREKAKKPPAAPRDYDQLKTKYGLPFHLLVPASAEEKEKEEKRIKDLERLEAEYEEDNKKNPGLKRKRLSSAQKSAKKRKIGVDGLRKITYRSGETDTMSLLSGALNLPKDVEDSGASFILHEENGETWFSLCLPNGQLAHFVLPGKI